MKQLLVLILALAFVACEGEQTAPRGALDSATLLDADYTPNGPVDNRYFVAGDNAGEALHEFAGTLHISDHPMLTDPPAVEPLTLAGKTTQLFPGISLRFVSHDGYLIPADRGVLVANDSDSFWQIQVGPGRVWSEPGDDGMSRASFPFFLTSNIENETYNGLATFLYDDERVSSLNYQVVHQNAPFLITTYFTTATQAVVNFERSTESQNDLVEAFQREMSDRLEFLDWSELEEQYGADVVANFDSDVDPQKTVISGLIVDDKIYLRTVATKWGDYPYPQYMSNGIWSATKSMGGLVTLMHMAQKYGDGILDYKIKDYVEVTADHDGWENVTFRHALSMATGIGVGTNDVSPNQISVDYIASDVPEYTAWYLEPTLDGKVEDVFESPSYPWGPGEHTRYRDRDTFILAVALHNMVAQKEGKETDMWQMMLNEVYQPIGIHHLPHTGTKDADRTKVPFLGWGMYMTADDIAKVARLLQNGGEHNGTQLLSKAGVAEALYETDVRGLPTSASNEYGAKTYHLSLWHESFVSESGKVYAAPKMVGWGGVIVQLMPNGMIGFRIGSGGSPAVEQMMLISNKMKPFDEHGRR